MGLDTKMLKFIAQFNSQHGPNGASQYILRIDIDSIHKDGFLPINQYPKGSTFLVFMLPLDELNNDSITETDDEIKHRFQKQMYALIRERAKERNEQISKIKLDLKEMLKKKKFLETSTSELDLKGYAAAIYLLENEF